jgi:hypothetical protein
MNIVIVQFWAGGEGLGDRAVLGVGQAFRVKAAVAERRRKKQIPGGNDRKVGAREKEEPDSRGE